MQTRNDAIMLSIPGERYTPFTLAKKLGARAILESASFKQGRARYSIILVDEAFRLQQREDAVYLLRGGKEEERKGNGNIIERPYDILDALHEVAVQNRGFAPELPVPAAGIGFLAYDFVQYCLPVNFESSQLQDGPPRRAQSLPPSRPPRRPQNRPPRRPQKRDPIGVSLADYIIGHIYLIVDHYTDTIHLIGLNYAEASIDLNKAIDDIRKRLADLDFSYLAPPSGAHPFSIISDEIHDRELFIEGVKALQKDIRSGSIFQAVLSRRLVASSSLEPLEGYRRLRSSNPSPYLFYLDFGTFTILGTSPESLVRVKNKVASIRPIAGTRRRGENAEEDALLEADLISDPKERSEHLMLIDLASNDLGKIAEDASLRLTRNMEVEQYSHVMHIVSEVEARLRNNVGVGDVLRSVFPAGTVSGAPKVRAIEAIAPLEKEARSFYAGAVAYFDCAGGLDSCITIRSALVKEEVWYMQAGAGIVADSIPEREWEETNEKLGAIRAALSGGK